MLLLRYVVLPAALIAHVGHASADTCGGSMSKFVVPDYICFDAQGGRAPYGRCDVRRSGGSLVRQKVDFSRACQRHDSCYANRGAKKTSCDTMFYRGLLDACRSQLAGGMPEAMRRACIETALQYNDVVRGQATRRVGLWMTQQVPFTGKSACNLYVDAQTSAGVANATCN